ncbi:hypothetical protein CEXT_504751 [Caerostris extrusa]|uniref:Uncharacterized protein n=1 Tax=Caerostris extrusa TaxID=172846 RepID=A0AAV4TYZ6_CAEEX|nr:hypothetical protein CEXT_504751 [Caerostris extrusa]
MGLMYVSKREAREGVLAEYGQKSFRALVSISLLKSPIIKSLMKGFPENQEGKHKHQGEFITLDIEYKLGGSRIDIRNGVNISKSTEFRRHESHSGVTRREE